MTMSAAGQQTTLLITCGARAREVITILEKNALDFMKVECLPAHLHNTPQKIPHDCSIWRRAITRGSAAKPRQRLKNCNCGLKFTAPVLAGLRLSWLHAVNRQTDCKVVVRRDRSRPGDSTS